MAPLSPDQLRTRRRVEDLIRLIAPALDVVLTVGDCLSRRVAPEDVDPYPARVRRDAARPGRP
jgi:hypothetical protein